MPDGPNTQVPIDKPDQSSTLARGAARRIEIPEVRLATYADGQSIIAMDEVAQKQRLRTNFIHQSIASRGCYVATTNNQVAGYAVLQYTFFDHGLISMLFVDPDRRRSGIGSALVNHLENVCKTAKLFTLVPESEQPMQALLVHLGYQNSGLIENLSDGGKELVFFKPIERRVAPPTSTMNHRYGG